MGNPGNFTIPPSTQIPHKTREGGYKGRKMEKMHLALFILAAIACFLMGSASAMTHIVGGSHGWRVPENETFFEEWAKPRTFGLGDSLQIWTNYTK